MRKNSIYTSIFGALLVGSLGAVPAAQQAVPKAKVDTIVMTGCVGAGASANEFVLNNAKAEAVASTSPNIMHSAPAADMAKDGTPVSYALKGGELKAHVGHKVAVTGTMDDVKAGQKTDQPVGSAGTTSAVAPAPMAESPKTLNVQSVKMIAASCS